MKKLLIILVLLPAIWILQACTNSEGKSKKAILHAEKIPVSVIKLEKTQVRSIVQASGQFTTDDETNLSFKTGGVIEKIFVKEGDAIREGQVLAALNLTEINAQVSQARLGFEKATRDFDRVSNLYRDSVATLEQFQNAKTGLDVAKEQYEAAKFNRSYSEIRAVSSGFVLRKMASEGQVIQSGTTVFQTNGARQGKWMLKTGVSDKEWAVLSVGDKAVVHTDAETNQPLAAFVSRKSEGTDPSTGSFTIELTIVGTPTSVASGMFGRAVITPSNAVKAWAIPYDALLDGDAHNGHVFVTSDYKTAHIQPVTIVSITKEGVVVTAGLENAEAVIVSGSAYLRDQSPIAVIEQ